MNGKRPNQFGLRREAKRQAAFCTLPSFFRGIPKRRRASLATAVQNNIPSIARLRRLVFSLAALFIVCTSPTSPAADVASEFDSANQLYEQGKFAEAAVAYENLLRSGPVSPAIYFNLGNALFKDGQAGRALASYRKAEQLAPRDPDIRANLQFVRDQIQGPKLAPARWQRWLRTLTPNEWAALTSVSLWLCLISLATIQLRPTLKPTLRSVAWLGGVATVLLGGCLAVFLTLESGRTAIVTVHDAVVRKGPFEGSPTAFTVHDGAELSVLDEKNDWLQVTTDKARIGWLKREQVLLPSTGT
jgi:tetratricopeptide (TPR) repeat protein